MAGQLIRRWLWQAALNTTLITAIYIAAAYIQRYPPHWLRSMAPEDSTLRACLWLLATVLALPFFIATFRKLQALGLLIAEMKVAQATAGERTTAIRTAVAQIIPFAGMATLSIYVLVLTSAFLPPLNVLIALLVVVALLTWLFWRLFVKLYSRAQIALQETLSQPPPPRHEETLRPITSMLREAHLATLPIDRTSPAAGKLIREIQLRTRTGASIVGIVRNDASIINPGPDEELLAGDQVLLLGTTTQLDAAKSALANASSPRQ